MRLPKLDRLKNKSVFELNRIIDQAINQRATIYVAEVVKIRNKKAGYKGAELKARNKEDISQAQKVSRMQGSQSYTKTQISASKHRAKKQLKKAKKMYKELGIQNVGANILDQGLPNMNVLTKNKQKYINGQIEDFKDDLVYNGFNDNEIKKKVKKKRQELETSWDSAKRKVATMTKESIRKEVYNRADDFVIGRYFSMVDKDRQAQIIAYMKELSIEQLQQVEDVLLNDEFRKDWEEYKVQDSRGNMITTKNSSYYTVMEHRADEFLTLLKNETKKRLVRDNYGRYTTVDIENFKKSNNTFDKYL